MVFGVIGQRGRPVPLPVGILENVDGSENVIIHFRRLEGKSVLDLQWRFLTVPTAFYVHVSHMDSTQFMDIITLSEYSFKHHLNVNNSRTHMPKINQGIREIPV